MDPETGSGEDREAGMGAILEEKAGFRLTREGRFLSARLKGPHLCLSTSQVNGGEQQHLRYLLNHQSCEGKGHMGRHHDLAVGSREEYHRAVCADAGLPGEATALMGTAANMQNAAVSGKSLRGGGGDRGGYRRRAGECGARRRRNEMA